MWLEPRGLRRSRSFGQREAPGNRLLLTLGRKPALNTVQTNPICLLIPSMLWGLAAHDGGHEKPPFFLDKMAGIFHIM